MRLMQKKSGWAFLLFLWYCNSIWICNDLDLTKCLFLFYDTFCFLSRTSSFTCALNTDIQIFQKYTISQFLGSFAWFCSLKPSWISVTWRVNNGFLNPVWEKAGVFIARLAFYQESALSFFNDCAWDPFHAWLCLFIGVNRAGCCYN